MFRHGISQPSSAARQGPRGPGAPEGRCHRNSVQDPCPRRPGQAEEEDSRHPPCSVRPCPAVPFQGCCAQPAAPRQLPRCPARLHKNPTFRHVGPALPAASREVRCSIGAVRNRGRRSRESRGSPGKRRSLDCEKTVNEVEVVAGHRKIRKLVSLYLVPWKPGTGQAPTWLYHMALPREGPGKDGQRSLLFLNPWP